MQKVVSVVALKQVDPNSTSLGREPDLPLFAHQSNALGNKDPRLPPDQCGASRREILAPPIKVRGYGMTRGEELVADSET